MNADKSNFNSYIYTLFVDFFYALFIKLFYGQKMRSFVSRDSKGKWTWERSFQWVLVQDTRIFIFRRFQ